MIPPTKEHQLICNAAGGDVAALNQLLFTHRPRLLAYVGVHLPNELKRLIEPQDVVQDTYFEAVRRIGTFTFQGDDCFYAWLVTIARRQLLQMLRARRTQRRGGGFTRGDSAIALMQDLAYHDHTPSRSAAAHELSFEIEICMERIPQDYAKAIRLRYVEKLPFQDIAMKMDRSERAAQMLCTRGLKALRDEMKSMSRYI